MAGERWPPVYDAEDLKVTIAKLSNSAEVYKNFYRVRPEGLPYQGDIIRLQSAVPLIWDDGQAGILGEFEYWMVVGNTCDIDRNIEQVDTTQIVPIVFLGGEDVTVQDRQSYLTYAYSRQFYLPPWEQDVDGSLCFADFTKMVTIRKTGLVKHADIVASMTIHSWILLHSCLVRFLARDDGRFDD
ncbi:hypothetical protein [Microbulbifer sp. MCCC 1A16149]|uniref:hypothetical protein n=1 Tax=Microbulbifer sp. MCCC 1A16149 TaxID=3411322 RepID=UPI003D13993B